MTHCFDNWPIPLLDLLALRVRWFGMPGKRRENIRAFPLIRHSRYVHRKHFDACHRNLIGNLKHGILLASGYFRTIAQYVAARIGTNDSTGKFRHTGPPVVAPRRRHNRQIRQNAFLSAPRATSSICGRLGGSLLPRRGWPVVTAVPRFPVRRQDGCQAVVPVGLVVVADEIAGRGRDRSWGGALPKIG